MNRRGSRRSAYVAVALLALVGAAAVLAACDRVVGPRAEFTATPAFDYPPLEVHLDASASSSPGGAIVAYDWGLGDGDTASGVNVTHVYAEKGVYDITLVVTDSAGKTGARTRSVEALNRVPVALFSMVPPTYVPKDYPLRLDASAAYDPDGEIVQYVWSFGDGSAGEGMVIEHEYQTGNWEAIVRLTVIDENGGSSSTSKKVNIVGCDTCG